MRSWKGASPRSPSLSFLDKAGEFINQFSLASLVVLPIHWDVTLTLLRFVCRTIVKEFKLIRISILLTDIKSIFKEYSTPLPSFNN
jgi:hypothetical protein